MSEQMGASASGRPVSGGRRGGWLARGGRRVLIIAGLAVVIAGLVAMVGWRVVASEVRQDVTVSWAGAISCEGTRVLDWRPEPGAAPIPTIPMREGMSCVLPVRVANGGGLPVDVARLRLPYMGPEGAAAVEVPLLEGQQPVRRQAVDAVFVVDERLGPGESRDWEIVFRFRSDGCSSPGSVEWHDGQMPQVRVLALGRPGIRTAGESIGFRGTPESSCDS